MNTEILTRTEQGPPAALFDVLYGGGRQVFAVRSGGSALRWRPGRASRIALLSVLSVLSQPAAAA